MTAYLLRNLCIFACALSLSVLFSSKCLASSGTNRIKVVSVPRGAKVAKAQLGADGTIHVLVDAKDGPRYVKSTDAGVTFSAPMTIVDDASQKPGLKFHGEDLAVGKDGRVHVAMANNAWKLKLPEVEW